MTTKTPVLTLLLIGANLASAFAVVAAPGLVRELGFRADRPTLIGAFAGPFLHANLFHLLGNLVFLAAVGAAVELATGPLRFGLVYFASMLAGVGLHGLMLHGATGAAPLVGASGAVAGCAAYYGVRYRSLRVAVAPNRSLSVLAIVGFWAAVQLVGAFVHIGDAASRTAYWSHLGGLAMGAILALAFRAPDLGQARIGHEVLDRMNARGPAAAEAAARAHLRRHPDDPRALRDLAAACHDLGDRDGEADAILVLVRVEPEAERPALLGRLSEIGMASRLPAARRVALAQKMKENDPTVARALLISVVDGGADDVARPEALLDLAGMELHRKPERAAVLLHELTVRYPLHPCLDLARKRGWCD